MRLRIVQAAASRACRRGPAIRSARSIRVNRPMLHGLRSKVDVLIALAVGSTWGFLSVVSFTHPDPFRPITLIDYVAVASFSVALTVLAPAAWLVARVAGRIPVPDRRSSVLALAAATLFGALTFQAGGFGVAIGAWLVVGVAMWRGAGTVVRASSIITAIGGPVGGFGNLIEDGFGLKDVGGALFVAGLGMSIIGLLGLTVVLALGRCFALAVLCTATLAGIFTSTQYGGGLLILAVWFSFAAWIRRERTGPRTEAAWPHDW